MDNNERPNLLPEKDTRIQLVVNQPDSEEDTIDLGRVFHNVKVKSRLFAWVLVLCMLVGICAPLLMYQFEKHPLSITSVVTLRYDAPNPEYLEAEEKNDQEALKELSPMAPVSELVTPDGEPLDPTALLSSSVLQEAVGDLNLSQPITLEDLKNNITITRVLTEESSRTKEVLAGLADAKNTEAYNQLKTAEIKYQNRFVVTLTNGFGASGAELTGEELTLVLNRILDAYNNYLVKQYADVTLPDDRASLIDTAELDLPEVLDNLGSILDDLLAYCEGQPDTIREYRSWQTGLNLNDWTDTIKTVREVSVDYLEADVYSRGLIRDKNSVRVTFSYRLRTLQADLDKVNNAIAENEALLKSYRNNDVYVSMQESDSDRTVQITSDYYNELVLSQRDLYAEAADLRRQIAEVQNKLDRLDAVTSSADIADAEAAVSNAADTVRSLQDAIRDHMTEVFTSPLYTTYSEHSAPQGEPTNFLKASAKKMIIGAVAGAVIACGLWFLAALAPEFRKDRKDEEKQKKPEDPEAGKEAAEA